VRSPFEAEFDRVWGSRGHAHYQRRTSTLTGRILTISAPAVFERYSSFLNGR